MTMKVFLMDEAKYEKFTEKHKELVKEVLLGFLFKKA